MEDGSQRYWFQYFPENFMWSQGMMIAIEMARWGGSSMSEVDRVGQRLKSKVGDNEAWGAEWEREAQRIDQGLGSSRGVVLEVDVEPHLGKGFEDLLQGGNANVLSAHPLEVELERLFKILERELSIKRTCVIRNAPSGNLL